MTTDQHLSIAKYIREQWPVAHYFDTWHVAKGSRLKSKIPIHHAGLCHLGTTNWPISAESKWKLPNSIQQFFMVQLWKKNLANYSSGASKRSGVWNGFLLSSTTFTKLYAQQNETLNWDVKCGVLLSIICATSTLIRTTSFTKLASMSSYLKLL